MFESIILIILALIVFIIVYKIISKVIKAMIIALLIFVFLVASLGLIFYEDVKDLKDSTEERLILLEHDNEILTALEVKKLEKAGNYAFENIEDISLIKQKYGEHKWDDLTKEHGRMFVLDDRYFEGLPQQVDLSEISIQMERDSLLDVLVAPDPIEHYIDLAYSSETEEELDMVKQELMGEKKLLAMMFKSVMTKIYTKYDYHEYGGALLLGVDGTAIICHGSSQSRTIKNAILAAKRFHTGKINENIVEYISKSPFYVPAQSLTSQKSEQGQPTDE